MIICQRKRNSCVPESSPCPLGLHPFDEQVSHPMILAFWFGGTDIVTSPLRQLPVKREEDDIIPDRVKFLCDLFVFLAILELPM